MILSPKRTAKLHRPALLHIEFVPLGHLFLSPGTAHENSNPPPLFTEHPAFTKACPRVLSKHF